MRSVVARSVETHDRVDTTGASCAVNAVDNIGVRGRDGTVLLTGLDNGLSSRRGHRGSERGERRGERKNECVGGLHCSDNETFS